MRALSCRMLASSAALLAPALTYSRVEPPSGCRLYASAAPELAIPAKPAPMQIKGFDRNVICPDDIATLRAEIDAEREKRDRAGELGRSLVVAFSDFINSIHYGASDQASEVTEAHRAAREQLLRHLDQSSQPPGCREWGLQSAIEKFIIAEGFQHFLNTGRLFSRHELSPGLDDEEYIAGVMGLCQELSHYAMRRATALDERSVRLCSQFVKEVKAELLGFDFRNSPLRRRFDGMKYVERRCENILYELSFAPGVQRRRDDDAVAGGDAGEEAAQPAPAPPAPVLNAGEWATLREAYAANDQKREMVIKSCRDVQKAAKQAIYAAHRGDLEKAQALVLSARAGVREIWDGFVRDTPSLRFGSFSGALEELAEAEMFLRWLREVDAGAASEGPASGGEGESGGEEGKGDKAAPAALVPRLGDLGTGRLDAFGYAGALSDFTGEVGRVAVEKATRRDAVMVRHCLRAIFACYSLLTSLPLSGKGNAKKIDAVKNNLRKLEAIEYDLAVRFNQKGPSMSSLNNADDGGGEDGSREDESSSS